MCEYCGCQSIAAIHVLTREHDRALDHVRDAEQAAGRHDLDGARAACARLQTVLGPHTAVEEHALFPALASEFPAQVLALELEHRHVEAVIEGLHGPQPSWPTELGEAMSVLRNHILKEQDGVFPAALATLTVADWQQLDNVRASVGTALVGAL